MTDFSRAYTAEWHLYRVDAGTWADAGEVGGLVSASIARDVRGDAPEIDAGELTVGMAAGETFEQGTYRLSMRAIQGGAERVDVATLVCEASGGTIDRGRDTVPVAGCSVLHPAATAHVVPGEFAAAGQDGAQKAAEMLRACIQAPVVVHGSFLLEDNYNFAVGTPVLEAVWQLLRAGEFCMWPDGRGVVHIAPKPTEPVLVLDRRNASLIAPQVRHALDLSCVPNRYTATLDGASATAVNDDPESPTSVTARGYWIDELDDSPALLKGEGLQAYAERRLAELSTVGDEREYERCYVADVHPFSIVRGSMPASLLDGDMRVVAQSIDCSHGIRVTETAEKEVAAWR